MRADPVGQVNRRADGSEWKKTAHGQDFKEVSGPTKKGASSPRVGPTPDEVPGAGWKELQRSFGLDGHLPHETVHPSHVQLDVEGDTDTKPVLTWKDLAGNTRRGYTMEFHRDRACALRHEVKKAAPRLEAAHQILRERLGSGGGDAAAVALLHLHAGHHVDHILAVGAGHAAVPSHREQGADVGEDEVPVEKGHRDVPHPHRVHIILPHPHGHVYPTSVVCKELAEHIAKKLTSVRVAKAEGGDPVEQGRLFGDTSAANVQSALDDAGVGDVPRAVIRHHAAMRIAADHLSKLGPATIGDASGLEQVRANLRAASDHIAETYGHHPAPDDMSYVPPTVAQAYVEMCGGSSLWPKSFMSPEEAWSSTNSDDTSSVEVSKSTTPSPVIASQSTPETKGLQSKTPSQPPTPSPLTLSERPWHEQADAVEKHLAEQGRALDYVGRFPPRNGSRAPVYYQKALPDSVEVADGVKLKASVAGKVIYLTFTGMPYEAMQVALEGLEDGDDRPRIISMSDWLDLKRADEASRVDVLKQLARKYEDSKAVPEPVYPERVLHTVGGPQVGDPVQQVLVGPPRQPNRKKYPFVGAIDFKGIPIDVENLQGSFREGVDSSGTAWKVEMLAHYGEVRARAAGTIGAKGMDGDRLDVYVGPDGSSDVVVVVNQNDPNTGEPDEQKVMLGFSSVDDALTLYRRQYDRPGFYGGHEVMSLDAFKEKIASKASAGVPLAKSMTSVQDEVFTTLGIPLERKEPETLRAFKKAVAKVLKAVRRARLGRAGADDELARCHEEYERARDAMRYDVSKAEGTPGPAGVPVGTVSVHASGDKWVKRDDGWHDLGKDDAAAAKQDDETHGHSVEYEQTVKTLTKLRQHLRDITDPKERDVVAKQIATLRQRLAKLTRAERIGQHGGESATVELAKSLGCSPLVFDARMTTELKTFVRDTDLDLARDVVAEIGGRADPIAFQQAAAITKEVGHEGLIRVIELWLGEA